MKRPLTPLDAVVPMYHPRVILETALAQGADRDAVLKDTQLDPERFDDPNARISYLVYGTLARNAMQATGNPGLGIDFGERLNLANMGMMGLAVMSSATAREALQATLDFYRSVVPAWQLSLEVLGEKAVFNAAPSFPFGDLHAFATESLLVSVSRQATLLLNRELPVREVCVDYPAPPYAERFQRFSRVPVAFDAGRIQVVFDAAILSEPLTSPDPLTRELAARHCQVELARLPTTDSLLNSVRALLQQAPCEYASLESVARALGQSPRTLRRALERQGTSYSDLLSEVRKSIAMTHLGTASVEDLAQRLGFSDARSFRRAFKRWTGMTPTEYREQRKVG